MSKRPVTKAAPKKRTRRVEAWIYTVINPLIEALKVEKSFLDSQNWTWRYRTNSLEFIGPLESYVDSISLPNFEDFFIGNSRLEQMRKEHEELRETLSQCCHKAFTHLDKLDAFRNRVAASLSSYRESAAENPAGAIPDSDFYKLIAQYVINNIRELPGHYTTSGFWAERGKEFLEFRTVDVFRKLDAAGKHLSERDEKLLQTLKNLRAKLSQEFDVPPAPVSYSGSQPRSDR
jgi:hypothetical protein